jgi:hypothetical protein
VEHWVELLRSGWFVLLVLAVVVLLLLAQATGIDAAQPGADIPAAIRTAPVASCGPLECPW